MFWKRIKRMTLTPQEFEKLVNMLVNDGMHLVLAIKSETLPMVGYDMLLEDISAHKVRAIESYNELYCEVGEIKHE